MVPTLPENVEFCHYFSRSGKHAKCLEFVQKGGNGWKFKSKPGNFLIFIKKIYISRFTFQDFICKIKSFTFLSYLHYQHKLIQSQIDLRLLFLLGLYHLF